ncbi:MAG: DEAD/DEAH box helicase [Bdellovibrio sp.]|nr:MAG: DEAD/DEAH box helicase [Bdellovibrio sp.]
MGFSKLHPKILGGLKKCEFNEPTPIQAACIPRILEGQDVAGLAQTGTGKTAAFLLPLMDRVLRSVEQTSLQESGTSPSREELSDKDLEKRIFPHWKTKNFILILEPTRELAHQVYENFKKLGQDTGLEAVVIYGGTSYDNQKALLEKGVPFVIATPGRLIDLYKEHFVDLSQVRAVVFDEADRMFDMGFKEDMKFLLKRIPKERQLLLFSATLNFDVLQIAYEFGSNPVEIDVSRDQAKAEHVEDSLFHLGKEEKPQVLLSLIHKFLPRQAIVFSNFKHNVERIVRFLNSNGVPAVGISSLLNQAQRNRVMSRFREGNDRNILVATDVAARGLDIQGVDMVVNYELPDDPENYVHRIGRTGRAGKKGRAFSLVCDDDIGALHRIEDYLGNKIPVDWIDDEDLITDFQPFPSAPEFRPSQRLQKKDVRPRRGHRKRKSTTSSSRKTSGASRKKGSSQRSRRGSSRSSSPSERSVHRDRRLGRHQSRQENSAARTKKTHQRSSKRKASSSQRFKHRVRPQNSSVQKVSVKTGVGEKISRFFKKLFE